MTFLAQRFGRGLHGFEGAAQTVFTIVVLFVVRIVGFAMNIVLLFAKKTADLRFTTLSIFFLVR